MHDETRSTRWSGGRTRGRSALLAAVALIVTVVGTSLWLTTQASSFVRSAEAESGTIAGPAVSVDTAGASGAAAVRFGTTAGPSCGQSDIRRLVDQVSQANIEANLRKLVQDDTKPAPNQSISRHVSSPGNKQKTDWMKQQLVAYGLGDISQNFTSAGYSLTNPAGRLVGTAAPNTIYGIGAHIDSTSEKPATLAPGAEDDGSGVAVVMEVARVLAPYRSCLKSSVDFIGFNDEEENMKGSVTYVNAVKNGSGKTFKGMLNLDMVGFTKGGECIKADGNLTVDTPLTQKIVQMNGTYGVGLDITAGRYTYEDIDNASFWDAKLPSVYLVDCATEVDAGEYPHYHESTDTVTASNISFPQLTKLAKVLVATLAELAGQPQ